MSSTTKYTVYFTSDFKRAQRKIRHQKKLFEKLQKIVALLANGEPLPEKNRDHALTNSKKYKNCRECHVAPDLLLVYQKDEDVLILSLVTLGSHSNIF